MAEKIKILQITPRLPFPPNDGGKIGIANITKQFKAQDADVTLFCVSNQDITEEGLSEAREYADVILCKSDTENSPIKILKSAVGGYSLYVEKFSNKNALKLLEQSLEDKKFDIIHADHSCVAPLGLFAKRKQNIPMGLRLHNIEWLIWKRYALTLSKFSPTRFYLEKQAEILRKKENEFFESCDVCFAITEEDKKRAEELSPDANVKLASAGVDLKEWKPNATADRNPNEMIIATNYKWVHNVNGLVWLFENVLPEIKKQIPNAKLKLLGKSIPNKLNSYGEFGVEAIGFVDKVQPYLNAASVYVAPLFVGGGIRIKILEAMAMELPVVASPIAAEGIPGDEESGLFIAKDVNEWVNFILKLLQNPDFAKKTGEKAREYVKKNFSWEKNVGVMTEEYRKLIKKRSR